MKENRDRAILIAREIGLTWQQIGDSLGFTRQGAARAHASALRRRGKRPRMSPGATAEWAAIYGGPTLTRTAAMLGLSPGLWHYYLRTGAPDTIQQRMADVAELNNADPPLPRLSSEEDLSCTGCRSPKPAQTSS